MFYTVFLDVRVSLSDLLPSLAMRVDWVHSHNGTDATMFDGTTWKKVQQPRVLPFLRCGVGHTALNCIQSVFMSICVWMCKRVHVLKLKIVF